MRFLSKWIVGEIESIDLSPALVPRTETLHLGFSAICSQGNERANENVSERGFKGIRERDLWVVGLTSISSRML